MDKQKAKRAAALSAAAAVGSVGGSFGSDVIIGKKTTNNDSPVEEPVVEVVSEDNVQEHISSFGANDNTEVVEQTIIVDPVEPQVLDEPLEPEDPLDPEVPLDPEIPIEPEEPVEPEVPVEPEEPIFIDDPLGPIQDDVLMYGGPGMCDNMIYPEPVMYGSPNDDLYVNDIEGV